MADLAAFHGICRCHPPKTFLVAVVLMVLTSLVRDLQASEVWQKLPSQVRGWALASQVIYETCWSKKLKVSSDKPTDLY